MNESMARMRAQLKRGHYGYEYGNSSCAGDFDRLCVSIGSPNDEKRHVRRKRDVWLVFGALRWRLFGDGAHWQDDRRRRRGDCFGEIVRRLSV